MITLNLIQGTKEWIAARLENFTASEASAMMSDSKYMSRNELLDLKKTGVAKAITPSQQIIFDKGHATEEAARPLVEKIIGEELYPVTGLLEGTKYLASFDGLTMMEDIAFEHKLWNKVLAENVRNKVLTPYYYWQLEQQLLVSGAEKAIFVVSDGTENNFEYMWYVSLPERRAKLIAGWEQFAKDLAAHEVKAKEEKVIASEIQALPKLEIALNGSVSNSNLAEYKSTALAFIDSIRTDLVTDQDFVDAANAVKFFNNGEKELEAVKNKALEDTADIKSLFDTIDVLKEEMRQKRLTLSKLVKSRKEEIRHEISSKADADFNAFLHETSASINNVLITKITPNFNAAMKGKSTVESLQNSVDNALSQAKIEVNEIAKLIRTNLDSFAELASKHKFLFSDTLQLIYKENDDVINLIKTRISEHEKQEAEKAEQQRKAIQAEEERKAQAKVAAEQKAIADRKAELAAQEEAARIAEIKANDEALKQQALAQKPIEEIHPAVVLANSIDEPIKQEPIASSSHGEYEPLDVWPSDYDVSQSEELERVCAKLLEAELYIDFLLSEKAA